MSEGTTDGHILSGFFFFIYGVWWSINSILVYLSGKHKLPIKQEGIYKKENLRYKSYIPLPVLTKIPVEPILKVVLPFLGVLSEAFLVVKDDEHNRHIIFSPFSMYNSTSPDHELIKNIAKVHHITLYSAFTLAGIVDLLSMKIEFPKHAAQIFLIFPFFTEFLIFYFHTKDGMRGSVELILHWFLSNISLGSAIFAGLRSLNASNFLINTGFSVSLLLQGTWLFETGIVVHGAIHWTDTMNNVMFLVSCFVWHTISIVLGYLLLFCLMDCCLSRHLRKKSKSYKLLNEAEETEMINISN
ncbi:PREDICTED: transmembrane protein 45B-like [Amphimedon queenslandica]|uniref:Transmembrane protein 45B n=1 Tax=Amphimedon queenslandica TaxID=400682 RepID=A0A1X7TEV4_AMPQE|nr:PREDICTED: transmembrane protein 45B-like [Amphimedon queenslandica]|eukprot:XP_011407688.1 PREDICTED: transmembrane protein 45B-like [Amphimedon queenslandica]